MVKYHSNITISVRPEYYIVIALSLLLIPFNWLFSWMMASVFHELCHYAVLRLCGCRLFSIQIGVNGTTMDTELFGKTKEILCALSGPVGSLMLIFTGRWFPRLALCGLFQCAYNLIPIYPLDGGRAVRSFLIKLFSEQRSQQIAKWIENSVLVFFLLFGLYALFCLRLGFLPILFAVILIMKNKRLKCTCKELPLGVK